MTIRLHVLTVLNSFPILGGDIHKKGDLFVFAVHFFAASSAEIPFGGNHRFLREAPPPGQLPVVCFCGLRHPPPALFPVIRFSGTQSRLTHGV